MIDKFQGSLFGLACCDALGTTLEFVDPNSDFKPLTTIVGKGPFNLKKGEWTDDTSMALCLGASLIDHKSFNSRDQLEKYIKWWRKGHFSSNGTCFDIGDTVISALYSFEQNSSLENNPEIGKSGNGSLMRLCPVPLAYHTNPIKAIELSGESSLTTHASPLCIDACRLYGGLIVAALYGIDKETLLSKHYKSYELTKWKNKDLHPLIDKISLGSYKTKMPPEIKGTGYVVESLEAALWAFYNSDNFKEGALLAVNLCDDADTTGAIYGQLAGAYYGINAIPKHWLKCIALPSTISQMAHNLHRIKL